MKVRVAWPRGVQIALVIGANRGVGRETARQLAERGHDVIVTARDAGKAREAG